ncbi:MAG: PIN domain-containing protein [Oscillospiraceae bacterium]|nr:PIN domain-containing protein [Oscillospiraceae bacterium]
MKVLIDTCIIIDALQNREPFAKNAQQIFLLAANRKFTGYVTAKSVTDIYYLMHRCTHNDKETRTMLNKLLILFGIMDTASEDCIHALISNISDYEDAVMIETAKRSDADCIVTRNTKDYAHADITVYKPDEFISKIKAEEEID